MALTDLPATLQVIELYQFEQFTRSFWVLFIISFSLIYIFFIRPKEKETPFMSVAFIRGMFKSLSYVNLFTIPLLAFIMSPELAVWDVTFVYYIFYVIILSMYALTYALDMLKYGIGTFMIHGGLKVNDEKIRLAYRKLWGKNGLR